MVEFRFSSLILHLRKPFFLFKMWDILVYNSFELRVKLQAPVGAAYCCSGSNSFALLRMKMINHMPHRADAPFEISYSPHVYACLQSTRSKLHILVGPSTYLYQEDDSILEINESHPGWMILFRSNNVEVEIRS